MSEKLPEFPLVPIGYSRWVYRGLAWKSEAPAMFAIFDESRDDKWKLQHGPDITGGHICFHYIEAVKDPMTEGAERGFPRYTVVSDLPDFTVHDTKSGRDLFPTVSGNRNRYCKHIPLDTAKQIADALNHETDLTEALKVAGEAEEFALRCIAVDEVIIIKRVKEIDRLKGEWDPEGIEKREAIALEIKALEERVKRSREWLAALERIRNQSKP